MKLNQEQKTAAEFSINKNILVLAGAGTGKTRTLIGRVLYLVHSKQDPRRILLLTFTRKAAREMKSRLKLEAGNRADSIYAGTFHRFCLDIMKRLPKAFGIENRMLIDRDDQLSIMRMVRGQVAKKKKKIPRANQLLDYYSYARNTLQPAENYLKKHSLLPNGVIADVLDIFNKYEEKKHHKGYLDFDDILSLFSEKIHSDKKISDKLKRLFDHILVDEMQDTNPVQWKILEGLRDPAKLFCVGDDAQSIYAFRGADFHNVHEFSGRIPNTEVLKLSANYRSNQEILDLSNWLIAESNLKYQKELKAVRGKGQIPRLMDFDNPFDEADWICKDLMRRHEEGAKWADQMILVRTAFLTRELEGVLVENQIPYQFIGGTSLMQSAHVKDLLSMIRASLNPMDELSWIRYLKSWPLIGDVTATRIIDALLAEKDTPKAYNTIKTMLKDRDEIIDGLVSLGKFANKPEQAIKLARQTLDPVMEGKYDHWEARIKDLDLLQNLSKEYASLIDFIETYTLDPVYNKELKEKENDDAVLLITIHSAKGTEAPVCYLPQASAGVYPHIRSIGSQDQLEEERRILYVALTRAQNELIISRGGNRGRTVYQNYVQSLETSQMPYFLGEVPEHLVKNELMINQGNVDTFLDFLEDD